MAFDAEIKGRMPLLPANKRYPEAGNLEFVWGEFTNGAGDSGGEIDLDCDNVIAGWCSVSTNANAVKVELDTASAGKMTITTTLDDDGRFYAICLHR